MLKLFKIPFFFALFILLGLVFGYLTFKALSYSRTVEVPSLKNLPLLEANKTLSQLNLYLKIEGEDYDSSVPSGKILRQNIPPGKKVKEKRSIKVIVSKGPRIYSVPYIVNETLDAAEEILLQKALRIGKIIYVHSDLLEKGRIVAQKPEPDEKVTDFITALVSLGPHELSYYCPDFQNKNIDSVKEIAEKIGLNLEIDGTGEIVKLQKPLPGTVVKSGETVYLETREELLFEVIKEKHYD